MDRARVCQSSKVLCLSHRTPDSGNFWSEFNLDDLGLISMTKMRRCAMEFMQYFLFITLSTYIDPSQDERSSFPNLTVLAAPLPVVIPPFTSEVSEQPPLW